MTLPSHPRAGIYFVCFCSFLFFFLFFFAAAGGSPATACPVRDPGRARGRVRSQANPKPTKEKEKEQGQEEEVNQPVVPGYFFGVFPPSLKPSALASLVLAL